VVEHNPYYYQDPLLYQLIMSIISAAEAGKNTKVLQVKLQALIAAATKKSHYSVPGLPKYDILLEKRVILQIQNL
jgi:plasmid maintenance system killer protein